MMRSMVRVHVNGQRLAKIGLEIVARNVLGFLNSLKDRLHLLLPPRTSEYCAREWIKAHRLLGNQRSIDSVVPVVVTNLLVSSGAPSVGWSISHSDTTLIPVL